MTSMQHYEWVEIKVITVGELFPLKRKVLQSKMFYLFLYYGECSQRNSNDFILSCKRRPRKTIFFLQS